MFRKTLKELLEISTFQGRINLGQLSKVGGPAVAKDFQVHYR
jgi:hypothetical protein